MDANRVLVLLRCRLISECAVKTKSGVLRGILDDLQ